MKKGIFYEAGIEACKKSAICTGLSSMMLFLSMPSMATPPHFF